MSQRMGERGGDRVEARDRGLRRVRTATGWITVASAASVVVLAGGYAQALPGKSAGSGHPASTPSRSSAPSASVTRTSGAPSAPASAATSTSAPVLQAPTQAPTTAAPSTTHATSGGS